MRALITGVTGFAGSHLADYIVTNGHAEVHGVRRPRSRDEFINKEVIYHNGDVNDFYSIVELVSKLKPAYIFHLAAQSFVPLSWDAPKETLSTNIVGALNILEAVRRYSPDTIVQVAGSSEEYGFVTRRECPISEKQPLRPLSPYGVSKAAADLLSQQYYKSYGVKTVITRAFNHTGPRRREIFVTSKIAYNLALFKLKRSEPVLALGNLDAVRDFTDVRDIARAYWMAATGCSYGQPYNIGSGIGFSVKEVLLSLENISGVKPEVKQDPRFMRPSDVPQLICASGLFRRTTGWKPEIPFMQTMTDLFDFWMERLR